MLPISALSALLAATLSLELANAHGVHNARAHHDIAKRQTTAVALAASTSSSAASAAATTSSAAASGASGATTAAPSGTSAATTAAAVSGTGSYNVPPLSAINSAMPSGATPTLSTTFSPGAQPTYSGAPVIPAKFIFSSADWPALDRIPPTDSDQVKEWMKELDGHDIPDITPTVDGECASDPQAAAQAQQRGWWTCGGWTSGNDIVACPEKNTWGVSFDDGPAPYSEKLLKYLDDHDLSATFFVVGSRVVSYPDILIAEYMAGHEISVHTWSHHPLTAMTNEQIVAELGWTRHAIQTVLGVTPTTMRPPFGDIDNRVRAISNAMGLRPIIWTTGPGGPFDTNDWRVPAGEHTGTESFATFESILGNASTMDTGFIVLEHDLFEITVDLAVGYTLDAALTHNPPFKLESIGECLSIPMNDMYHETATTDIVGANSTSDSTSSNSTSGSSSAASGNGATGLRLPSSAFVGVAAAAVAAVFAGSL
ncbi:hypothetical protein L226DRAFT_553741 [Lentinus tigrinus ALCF2SS1-7]|uniref:chitin deacetylase n=1 Tax=Lentinus tigrinus ALCF2SS1-6 TaxID=1328759 RepID=A0A5C2S5M7_9APHY|nr:hypothetical protein L227DRAFT_504307 [Lentinus tigrinus ALCF2SS1-6]RPD73232.1 hypothetical protein L226DRAFT_553741 [Lentinus tigrinus ALCF2SS1-7]